MENTYSKLAMQEAQKFLEKYPDKKEDVQRLFQLMQDEINDGSSPSGEYESFIQSLNDLENE